MAGSGACSEHPGANDHLRELLRSARCRIRPEDVGLPRAPRQVSVGLTRDQVAELAGISVTWYARLEGGREAHPSTHTLLRIADVLQLTDCQRRELLDLVRPELHEALRVEPRAASTFVGLPEIRPISRLAKQLSSASSITELGELVVAAMFESARPDRLAYFIETLDAGRHRFSATVGAAGDKIRGLVAPLEAWRHERPTLAEGGTTSEEDHRRSPSLDFRRRVDWLDIRSHISAGVTLPDGRHVFTIGHAWSEAREHSPLEHEMLLIIAGIVAAYQV